MRLKDGASVCVGRKTWTGEIPEKAFKAISEGWTSEQRADFRKSFEQKDSVEPKLEVAAVKGVKKEK